VNSSPVNQPQTEPEKLHFLDYWQVIAKRKEVIIATAVIMIFAVTVYSFVMRSEYTATAQIKIDTAGSGLKPFVSPGMEYMLNRPLDEADFNTHQEQITSAPVLKRVIRGDVTTVVWRCKECGREYPQEYTLSTQNVVCTACGGTIERVTKKKHEGWIDLRDKWTKDNKAPEKYDMDLAVGMLRRRISVRPVRGTRLINISYTSPDQKEVALIANMVAEVYKQEQERQTKDQVNEALSVLVEEIDTLLRGSGSDDRPGLLTLEKQLDDFKHEHRLLINSNGVIEQMDLNRFRANRLDLEVQITGREERLDRIESVNRDLKVATLLGQDVLDEFNEKLDAQRRTLESAVQAVRTREPGEEAEAARPTNYEIEQAREAIKTLNTAMDERLKTTIASMRDGLVAMRAEAADAEKRIDELEAGTDLSDEQRTELETLRARRSELGTTIAEQQAKFSQLDEKSRELNTAMLEGSQSLYDLKRMLKEQEIGLSQQLSELGDEHPQVKRTRQTIQDLKASIDNEIEGILNTRRIELESLQRQREELDSKIKDLENEIFKKEELLSEYRRLAQEVDRLNTVYAQLMQKKTMEFIEQAIPSASIKITEDALPPTRPSKPNRLINIIIGVVVGLTVGTGLAYFIEYLDTSVKTIDDLERNLNMPILGVIPQRVKLLTEVTHKSPAYEAYRMLWTNIEFARQDAKLRTLLVTSGGVGEGKTTSLVNLAIVAAREGNRVLVIDSDFRRPRVHKLLGITNHVGLTDVLLRNVDPGRVAVETAIPDLWVLPSGKLPPNAMGLLNSRNMRECIEYLYDKYDIILFDSPPVIGVSDASVLAGLVDRIVLVVEYRKYPKSVATRAKKILENVGGKILGGVINNLNIIKEDYYYYSQVYHYFQASGDKAEDDEAEEGDEAGEGREAADGDTDADGPDKTDE
jgi:succinoglycan biosynthesis transport protein ExoP